MNFRNQTALVTGASRGIGRAIAQELATTGLDTLILVARQEEALQQVAQELRQSQPLLKTVVVPLDLTDPIAVNTAVAKVWRDHGPIHLLVNCAGVAYQSPFLQSRFPEVYQEISLNLLGLYSMTRCVARRMVSQGQGTIVNVSSLMGKVAAPTMATYCATKFAILGFSEALRGELQAHNIKVVTLLPTLTDTDMTKNLVRYRGVKPMTAGRVAQSLVRGLRRNQTEIVVGWQSHLALWCQKLAPWLLDRILLWAMPQSV
jgi:3-oxoacyl-[acyl-carrier protein] reductase